MDLVVGVDVGGTNTVAALVTSQGRVGEMVSAPTPAALGPQAVLGVVSALVADRRAAASGPDVAWRGQVRAVGIGTAGVVDVQRGKIIAATDTFPGWPGTLVRDLVASACALPVHLENDVDAHAAGEVWTGAAAGASSALVVAVGTGVGSALVLQGRCVRGAHSASGEMAHMPSALAGDRLCPCGRTGHLEAVAAGPAVLRAYLCDGGDPACSSTPEVFARLHGGDLIAQGAVHRAADALGQALAALVTTLDPEVVVIGGGLTAAGAPWWQQMEASLRAELIDPFADLPVRLSALGGAAPVIGAARGAWRLLHHDEAAREGL